MIDDFLNNVGRRVSENLQDNPDEQKDFKTGNNFLNYEGDKRLVVTDNLDGVTEFIILDVINRNEKFIFSPSDYDKSTNKKKIPKDDFIKLLKEDGFAHQIS